MEYTQFIDGILTTGSNRETWINLNPANNEPLGEVYQATNEDIEAAVQSSEKAFRVWRTKTGAERGRVLLKAADILRSRVEQIALVETQDVGKPISESLAVDITSAADALEYFGGMAAGIHGEYFDLKNAFGYTRPEPLGVCAGIGAWNYPIQIAAWKAAPALACGNAMIFKPSELTPATALELAKAIMEAGAPDGLFNVVQGDGRVGSKLVEHPGIAKISLTGSVSTGKKIFAGAASQLKRVTLELGGKSPLIIFEDADIHNAVSAALLANFYTQGEVCSNGTRVFVHRKIFDIFLRQLKERTEKIRVGDPADPETQLGALISKAHMEKVMRFIEAGKAAGATLLTGGFRPEKDFKGRDITSGNFLAPAIFTDCDDAMEICKEEIFGPVLSILCFDSEEEVIERANNTAYGLAAGVFTNDIKRGHRVIHQLQAGTCWINNYNITPIEIPFGGYKQSGLGRENSLAALQQYTQLKTVYVELGNVESPF
ncbi:betaine-aldehyde dehydrogenase [Agriterribacter sp.]|uniref:betaine-aldehyde dehydrogenase n=1 Tax=Agriterribacter sp. TaxID=2821509 RepID=UPI002CBB9EFB|nr:betaine-aldehyde dehydrogenase [Agriterribacter sp.]HRO44813.1 betaine-aldehyde dehydrogenase [Agriterribacter sp.]HRQ19154.1 betaine-aldehyde dehydrogenase [Agriterribacter sp.]